MSIADDLAARARATHEGLQAGKIMTPTDGASPDVEALRAEVEALRPPPPVEIPTEERVIGAVRALVEDLRREGPEMAHIRRGTMIGPDSVTPYRVLVVVGERHCGRIDEIFPQAGEGEC